MIDDDIYDHLVKNVKTLGEDASSILRRLLDLPHSSVAATDRSVQSLQSEASKQNVQPGNGAVTECLNHSRFNVERNAVGRFLFALGWLQKRNPDKFQCVLDLSGRTRKYFARSANELEASGESVNAQRVPDSQYWVITNNDTPKKKRVLADVMGLLGYRTGDINQLTAALD